MNTIEHELGRLVASCENNEAALARIERKLDERLVPRLDVLEARQARFAGAVKVWGTVLAFLEALALVVIGWWLNRGHHGG